MNSRCNLPFNLSRVSRRSFAVSLIVLLLLSAAPPRGEAAATLRQQENLKAGMAQKLYDEGVRLYQQGTDEALRKAFQQFEKALSFWRELRSREGQAMALLFLGRISSSLSESQKALQFYTEALLLWRAVGDRGGEAATLSDIGVVYSDLGENQKALDFYTQALPLRRAVGDRDGEAATLNNIGTAYSDLGEKQKALDFYAQALPLVRAVGDRRGEATMLNNIGLVYSRLGEKQKALDFYTRAFPLRRAIGDRYGEAATLSDIGKVYSDLGEKQKALDFYTQALPLRRAVGDRRGEAATLSNIGLAYSGLAEKEKALDFYAQALPLWRTIGDRYGEAATLNGIGVVYGAFGEKQKALDFFAQALPLRRAVGDRYGEAETLTSIGGVERALGRLNESRIHLEESLKITELLRTEIVSRELRASFFATVQDVYEFYVDLLMQLHKQEPGKNHHAAALQTIERARARSLLENLTEARADIRRGIDPKLLAQERALQQHLNAKAEELLKLAASGADETRLATSKRGVDALTTELQQVQTQIRQTSPRYAALTQPQPLTSAEIQQQVLDEGTLLLEYALGDERSFLWAVTPAAINSYELPKRQVIEQPAERAHELLLARSEKVEGESPEEKFARIAKIDAEITETFARLGQMLLAPVAQQLSKKRLVIVADGVLHVLPFGALPDPNAPNGKAESRQPLIVEHEVVNLPSASTLAVLRRELKGRQLAEKTLAMLADPVFTADDKRIKWPTANGSVPNFAKQLKVQQLIQSGLPLTRLPYSRKEAEQISAIVPAGEGMMALSFEASRATAVSDQLSQYRYVHFATHGLADSERPELSTIVLSLFDEQGKPVDGFLRAHEVYNLNLSAEMVVLSACETGLGKQVKGEGLVSLTRGFMYAGAPRVVVSLWSVNDQATAELMTKFYRKILVDGERPAAALRSAQIEMWRTKQWEAPYYWAAFTLQGEWR